MQERFHITSIRSVLHVPAGQYPPGRTVFSGNVRYNELIFYMTSDSTVFLGTEQFEITDETIRLMPAKRYSRYEVDLRAPSECFDIFSQQICRSAKKHC